MLMQFQADIIGVDVVKPRCMETTAIGAAFAAGLAVGIYKSLEEIQSLWSVQQTFTPKMDSKDRAVNFSGWNKAVSKSLGWVDDNDDKEVTTNKEDEKLLPPLSERRSNRGVPLNIKDLEETVNEQVNGTHAGGNGGFTTSLVSQIIAHLVVTSVALGVGLLLAEQKPNLLKDMRASIKSVLTV
jgi:hypothetical protein